MAVAQVRPAALPADRHLPRRLVGAVQAEDRRLVPEPVRSPAAGSPPMTARRLLRLAVYCDYSYRVADGITTAELPFSLFVEGLAPHCDRLVVLGREDPSPEPFPYRLWASEFV